MEQNKKTRITYLFGAGASCGNGVLFNAKDSPDPTGIPVVDKFNDDIGSFIQNIKTHRGIRKCDFKKNNELNNMICFLEDVYEKFKHFYSFDTYAKSLYESIKEDREEYQKLKVMLKLYIVFRQAIAKRDRRYDLLFGSLINNHKLPNTVNFLSWNYDTQIELSLSNFNKNVQQNRFEEFIDYGTSNNYNKSQLIKLNGSISQSLKGYEFVDSDPSNNLNISDILICIYNSYRNNNEIPQIEFSWDKDVEAKAKSSRIQTAENILTQTDIFIIIGYSFPTLNRRVDKQLLHALNNKSRIIVQCKDEQDFKSIRSKIFSLLPQDIPEKIPQDIDGVIGFNEIERVTYIDSNAEFYVPFEFES
jgi:hypothetical protein